MDIKSLRLFLGIIKHRSITKASKHLYIAQPALGLYLRRLEDEIGVDLVTRHARGVTPTAAGLKLAEHAERLISQMHYIKNELQNLRDTPIWTCHCGSHQRDWTASGGAVNEAGCA